MINVYFHFVPLLTRKSWSVRGIIEFPKKMHALGTLPQIKADVQFSTE